MKINRSDILFIYEENCGGETVSSENIFYTFLKYKNHRTTRLILGPNRRTSFINYFSSIIVNITRSLVYILKIKPQKWIYTVTYTAGIAASLLKPLFKFNICYHYHASRIPPAKDLKLHGLHVVTQKTKHSVTYWLHKIFIMNADLIIVPSEYTKKQFTKKFPFTQKNKIFVINNGIDTKIFKPVNFKIKEKIRKSLDIPAKSRIILYSGRIDKQKQIIKLIKSFILLQPEFRHFYLIIAYPKIIRDDEFRHLAQIQSLVSKEKMDTGVKYLQSHNQIQELYRIADIVISLSRRENLPMNMLEAFATKSLFAAYPAGEVNSILNKIDVRLKIYEQGSKKIADKINSIFEINGNDKRKILNLEYEFAKNCSIDKVVSKIEFLLFR